MPKGLLWEALQRLTFNDIKKLSFDLKDKIDPQKFNYFNYPMISRPDLWTHLLTVAQEAGKLDLVIEYLREKHIHIKLPPNNAGVIWFEK